MNNKYRSGSYVRVTGAIAVLAGIVGFLYTALQSLSDGGVKDPFFVGLLISNNLIIWKAISLFTKKIYDEHNRGHLPVDATRVVEKGMGRMSHLGYGLSFGIAFGLVFFSGPFIVEGVWENSQMMRIMLAVFLALCNVLTGMALNSLYWFIRLSTQLGEFADVYLWQSGCPIADFIMSNGRQVAIAVAIVSVFAVTSVLFSQFQTESIPIVAFGLWSLLVSVAAYVLPLIPLTRKLSKIKDSERLRLGKLVESEYRFVVKALDSGTISSEDDAASYVVAADLLDRVRSRRIFPPVGARPVETAFWVGLLTFLPTIIDWLVNALG